MGNAAGGMEGGAAGRESRDNRLPVPPPAAAAAAPPPARQPMPAAAELEERFGRVLVSAGGLGGTPCFGGGWGGTPASGGHLCFGGGRPRNLPGLFMSIVMVIIVVLGFITVMLWYPIIVSNI